MPKVTVIIPVYGVEKYIERCARSLFEQTLDDIEYLFVDDCTPDKSIEILEHVLEYYPQRKKQVRIHRMSSNSGQAKVREWGIKNASGAYMIHCDSDDWVDVDAYRTMYDEAIGSDADVVVCDYVISNGINTLKEIRGGKNTNPDNFLEDLMFQRVPWSLCNKLFKRQLVERNFVFPSGNMGEDMAITLQLMQNCTTVRYIPKAYYFYYINAESITRKLTHETILKNFFSTKENANIVLSIFKDVDQEFVQAGLLYMQYNVLSNLFPVYHMRKYRILGMNTYHRLFKRVILCRHFPVRHKLIFLSAVLGIYPHKI